jgi:hypothetical protein
MRDKKLQSDSLRGSRSELGCHGARVGSGGAVRTGGGIDRRICHPTSQPIQPVTGPPHIVGNRASVTAARSLTANPQASVSFLPALAKGWNRPFFPLRQSWDWVGNRPVAEASNGGAFGFQMYQGGIDSGHRSPHAFRQNRILFQNNTPCWIPWKEVTSRQSSPKPAKCRSKDNIGSPNP